MRPTPQAPGAMTAEQLRQPWLVQEISRYLDRQAAFALAVLGTALVRSDLVVPGLVVRASPPVPTLLGQPTARLLALDVTVTLPFALDVGELVHLQWLRLGRLVGSLVPCRQHPRLRCVHLQAFHAVADLPQQLTTLVVEGSWTASRARLVLNEVFPHLQQLQLCHDVYFSHFLDPLRPDGIGMAALQQLRLDIPAEELLDVAVADVRQRRWQLSQLVSKDLPRHVTLSLDIGSGHGPYVLGPHGAELTVFQLQQRVYEFLQDIHEDLSGYEPRDEDWFG